MIPLSASEVKAAILRKKWKGKTPPEWGFKDLPCPVLQRRNRKLNEYHFYTSEAEYTITEAKTLILALEKNPDAHPVKIFHANCRIDSMIPSGLLEPVPAAATATHDTEAHGNPEEDALKTASHAPPPAAG